MSLPPEAVDELPSQAALRVPVLRALLSLGGEASNDQIASEVARVFSLSEGARSLPHDPSKGGRTEFEYRLAWARTRLKAAGEIEGAGRMVWRLTDAGRRRAEAKP